MPRVSALAAIAIALCPLFSLDARALGGPDLKHDGAFGFPQKDAKVLCDAPELRVSAWNDAEHLYVQAVVFADGDDAPGETEDGRAIGDSSTLLIDADADGKATPEVDRNYTLNPWPSLPGLQYQIVFDDRGTSGLMSDSKGRGAISYVEAEPGHRVRVDSYLIPLSELKRKPGETVRFAYWGSSPHPELTVNSIGFQSKKRYYPFSLPLKDFHSVALADRATTFDEQQVPEGRKKIAVHEQPGKPMPAAGSEPPEIAAAAWLNWKGESAPTLKSLRGKVVVVEFWATWCGPCVAGIPHLNQIHDAYADKGLVILSLTDQSKTGYIEEFMKKTPMHYVVGVGSNAVEDYGVTGIPHAFVIGRDGKVAWEGYPMDEAFEKEVGRALGK